MTTEAKIILTAQDRTRAAVQSAKRGLQEVAGGATSLHGVLARLGSLPALGAIGGALSGAGIAAFIKQSIDAADAANDMAQRFGLAVEDIAAFDLAARQSGTSLDGVAAGMKAFSKFVTENGDALREAGIDTTNTRQAFIAFADVVAKMPDGLEKTALAQKALGKAGADLIPLLNLGSQGLQESADKSAAYGARLAALAPQADSFNDKMEELKLASSALGINLATALIPSLAEVATRMADATRETGGFRGALRELADFYVGNSFKAIGKDVQADLAQFDLFVQKLKGDDEAVAKTYARIRQIYTEMDALGGGRSIGAAVSKQAGSGIEEGNKSIADALARRDELIKKLLAGEGSNGRGGRAPRTPKPQQATDPLGDLIGSLDGRESDRLEQLRDRWVGLIDPIEHFRLEYAEVEELAREGYLTSDQSLAAYRRLDAEMAKLGESAEVTGRQISEAARRMEEMDAFGQRAAMNIQDAFADFLFDPFKDGVDGMLHNFGVAVQRMIAQAVAANLANRLFGQDGADLGSLLFNIADWALGGSTQAPAPVVERGIPFVGSYAVGTEFVPRTGLAMIHRGERIVSAEENRSGGPGGGINLVQHFHIAGNADPATIRRSAAQGAREVLSTLNRAGRYA